MAARRALPITSTDLLLANMQARPAASSQERWDHISTEKGAIRGSGAAPGRCADVFLAPVAGDVRRFVSRSARCLLPVA